MAVVGPDDPAGAEPSPGPAMTVAPPATGTSIPDGGRHVAQPREALPADRLDEELDDPAAGEPDVEGGVVADAVGLQHRLPGLRTPLAPVRTRRLPRSRRTRCRPPRRRRRPPAPPRVPRGAAERVHDGCQAEGLPESHHFVIWSRMSRKTLSPHDSRRPACRGLRGRPGVSPGRITQPSRTNQPYSLTIPADQRPDPSRLVPVPGAITRRSWKSGSRGCPRRPPPSAPGSAC